MLWMPLYTVLVIEISEILCYLPSLVWRLMMLSSLYFHLAIPCIFQMTHHLTEMVSESTVRTTSANWWKTRVQTSTHWSSHSTRKTWPPTTRCEFMPPVSSPWTGFRSLTSLNTRNRSRGHGRGRRLVAAGTSQRPTTITQSTRSTWTIREQTTS